MVCNGMSSEARRSLIEGIRRFRLVQDFVRPEGNPSTISVVPVMVPNPHWFIRVRPGSVSCRTMRLYRDFRYRYYPVDVSAATAIGAQAKRYTLVTAMNSLGQVFRAPG